MSGRGVSSSSARYENSEGESVTPKNYLPANERPQVVFLLYHIAMKLPTEEEIIEIAKKSCEDQRKMLSSKSVRTPM